MAIFSHLLPPLVSAYSLQGLLALFFVPAQNEKYYDLGGALGFVSTAFVSLYHPYLKARFWEGRLVSMPAFSSFAPRQLIITAALGIWTTRLGIFLTKRAIEVGGDSRFDAVKTNAKRFTFSWMAQATWVFVVGLPVYLCHAMPSALHPPLSPLDYTATGLIVTTFILECLADYQKASWKAKKGEHNEKFISSGLWSISRHPNYAAEIGIWTGMWALSVTALRSRYFPTGAVAVASISPLFTYFIIRNFSGVNLLEKTGDKKFGDDPEWKAYKKRVPVLFPWGGMV